MPAYYNELDPQKAEWLRELIKRNLIARGDVDERSIAHVRSDDLRGYTQCHFFAGIGVWSYSLRLAGWPDDREVWTGSCPCQPFSDAGKKQAFNDERHLWPVWFLLIRARRPVLVLGEQVASADGLAWFDSVHSDLGNAGYSCGAVDLCAAGFGAPHRRQRLFFAGFLADAYRERCNGKEASPGASRWGPAESGMGSSEPGELAHAEHAIRRPEYEEHGDAYGRNGSGRCSDVGILAHSSRSELQARIRGVDDERGEDGTARAAVEPHGADGGMAHCSGDGRRQECPDDGWNAAGNRAEGRAAGLVPGGADGGMADSGSERRQQERQGASRDEETHGRARWNGSEPDGNYESSGDGADGGMADADGREGSGKRRLLADDGILAGDAGRPQERPQEQTGHRIGWTGPLNGYWRDADWIFCRDKRWRPVRPGSFPLAHGAPSRVVRLRGYGDAINAEAAKAFIKAVMECV